MSAIDPIVIAERIEEMEEAFPELVTTFIEDAQSSLVAIRQAVDSDQADELRQHAHALKSSSGYMGASKIVALASALELAARNGAAATQSNNVDALAVATDEAVAELVESAAA